VAPLFDLSNNGSFQFDFQIIKDTFVKFKNGKSVSHHFFFKILKLRRLKTLCRKYMIIYLYIITDKLSVITHDDFLFGK